MRVRHLLPFVLGVVLLAGSVSAQGCSLTSTFSFNDFSNGFMFDLVDLNPAGVDVTGFVVNLKPGLFDIDIYERAGSFQGFETSSAGWTLVGSVSNLVSEGTGNPTEVPIPMTVNIPSGTTHAFYIVSPTNNGIWGSQGIAAVGAVFNSNADLQFIEGVSGPVFGAGFNDVIDTVVRYRVVGAADLYQTNTAGSSMNIDHALTFGCTPGVANNQVVAPPGCPISPAAGELTLGTRNAGQAWELVSSPDNMEPVPGLGLNLGVGGLVNLNFANFFTWSFNNGGALPALLPFPAGFPGAISASFTINYSFTAATNLSAQGIVTDPGSAAGFTLTQANELHVTASTGFTSVPGPSGDDTRALVDFSVCPLNWAPGGFPFYGTTFTQVWVESNGRVVIGNSPPTFLFFTLFTPADVQGGSAGTVGMWADLNPDPLTGGGNVTINWVPPFINVDYVGVPYFNEPNTANTYQIQLDTGTGAINLNGLQGIATDPEIGQVDAQFLGLSPAAALLTPATDPGVVMGLDPTGAPIQGFTPNGVLSGFVANPLDMIYDFFTGAGGVPSTLATVVNGTSSVTFIPDGTGNYQWIGI